MMAKQPITNPSYPTDNIQNQPNQPTITPEALQLLFDQVGIDITTYLTDTFISELNGNQGAFKIGFDDATITADNVGDALIEIKQEIIDIVLGQIPDNSLTELKMAAEMKKQAGGVAKYNDLQALRIAETDTGVADAYVVTTGGPFERVDGNTLPFIPANNNTGASTINEDGNGVAPIQKYVDGAWIALEEGDLKKFQQVQLVWNASESAFQLAPKGGATIKSIQRGVSQIPSGQSFIDVVISSVDELASIVRSPYTIQAGSNLNDVIIKCELINNTTVRLSRNNAPAFNSANIYWVVIEYNNVKSLQKGTYSLGVSGSEQTVNISSINVDKSQIFSSFTHNEGSSQIDGSNLGYRIINNTTIGFETGAIRPDIHWQVIEFN